MQHSDPERLIVLLGPTACGKSGLAVEIATIVGGEVISADSRQVYRGLDIGTEKITLAEMKGVPHHCIDIASPRRSFSVEQWRRHAERAVAGCMRRGNVPILAGGTGLYVDALVFGTQFPAVKPNTTLRKRLSRMSTENLFSMLTDLDPERARTIEAQNPRRLIRAIEVATALGKVPPLAHRRALYPVTWIGIAPPFATVEERIATRLDRALGSGLVDETRMLREDLHLSWTRIDELGMEYRVCARYLRGEIPEHALRDTLVSEVRRYAKRQMTWLKRYDEVPWYESAGSALSTFVQMREREARPTHS